MSKKSILNKSYNFINKYTIIFNYHDKFRYKNMKEELSLDESLESAMSYVEKGYNTTIDQKMKECIKKEVKQAIPELNKILTPLINSAVSSDQSSLSQSQQADLVKKLIEIMMPHMQKIITASE
ncbi:hypothetical protein DRF75_03655 [Ehrlichia minasensis]|uniref:Uncharacterized protein n=2 Tax=Ehrlichia minasensis TaxID=1242993 RepID=A0A4Q6I7G9_9RICK|nr:hypothetical protein DRF75_03655 [Ehrlichia minasensis]